jgi:hypothetical protein
MVITITNANFSRNNLPSVELFSDPWLAITKIGIKGETLTEEKKQSPNERDK